MEPIVELVESLTPIIWVRTIEEERFIKEFLELYKEKPETRCFIHRRSQGRQDASKWLAEYCRDGTVPSADSQTTSVNAFMDGVYREVTEKLKNVYLICNADEHMQDTMFRRRLRDLAAQQINVDTMVKVVVLISHSIDIPSELNRYIQVCDFNLMSLGEIESYINWIRGEAEAEGQDSLDEMDTKELAQEFKGLSQIEIVSIAQNSIKEYNCIRKEAITAFKRRASRRSEFLVPLEKGHSFDDIGGQERLKEWIHVAAPAFTQEGRDAGLPLVRGLLTLGPPGTGKSLNAKAACTEMGLPGFHFDPSKLFAGRVGESESRVRQAIRDLEANAPCLVFIDEIEKGFSGTESSGQSDAGTTARVVGTFLNWMQEHESPIFMVATANDITKMSAEMIQRFDETFYVAAPSVEILADIIRIHLEKYKVKGASDFDCQAIAEAAPKLVGREIDQGVKSARLVAFHQKRELDEELLIHVFKTKVPLVETMNEKLQELETWVGYSEEKKDGIRARFANNPRVFDVKPKMSVVS